MPLRSVKMKRFIFGFQRRVWCPKWTPLSSRFFMLTTATWRRLPSRARTTGAGRAARLSRAHREVRRPGVRPRHRTRRRGRDRGGDCPAAAAGRGHAKSARRRRTASTSIPAPPARPDRVHPQPGRRSTTSGRRRRGGPAGGTVADVSAARLLVVLAVVLASLVVPSPAAAAPPSALWGWPLSGEPVVTRGFDPPPTPYAAGHRGVDLAATVGQPVLAAGAGTVSFSGVVAGRGVVTVRHTGGLRTTYEPVDDRAPVGTTVRRGDRVGALSSAPGHCRPLSCLHWGAV